jgi:hypothetical protein
MTEQEWLECTEATPMLEFMSSKASVRKLRLFASGLCRSHRHFLVDDTVQRVIGMVENVVDGFSSCTELIRAWTEASDAKEYYVSQEKWMAAWLAREAQWAAGEHVDMSKWIDSARRWSERREDAWDEQPECQCFLMRDIFGNPFRPVSLNPAWLTPTVTTLASAAYEDRNLPSGELDAARLAILADALEEAECDNADILNHLRSPAPHVRGCWAVDLLLGKE